MKNKKTVMLFLTIILVLLGSYTTFAKTVAKIGSRSYSSLQAAADAVRQGQTIKLQSNINLNQRVDFNKNVKYTIDLNKYKIQTRKWNFLQFNTGTITIKNGTVFAQINIQKKANVTIKSGIYKRRRGDSGNILIWNNGGTLVIKNGTFDGVISSEEKRSFTKVTGGTFSCTMSASDSLHISKGNATIKGGKFLGSVVCSGGKMTIEKGTFLGGFSNSRGIVTIKKATMKERMSNFGGKMTIYDGTFHYDGIEHSSNTKTTDHVTLSIHGGTVKILGGKFTNKYNGVINMYFPGINTYGDGLGNNCTLIVKGGSIQTSCEYCYPIMMSRMIEDKVTLNLNWNAFPGRDKDDVVYYM